MVKSVMTNWRPTPWYLMLMLKPAYRRLVCQIEFNYLITKIRWEYATKWEIR